MSKCPRVPAERKKWQLAEWIAWKKANNDTRTPNAGNRQEKNYTRNSNGGHRANTPRGQKRVLSTSIGPDEQKEAVTENDANKSTPPGVKKAKQSAVEQKLGDLKEKRDFADGLADGLAELAGLPCFYVCDGGCDRATISEVFAQQLETKGISMSKYSPPRTAILANGAKVPSILGYLVADVMVKTRAGEVILPQTKIDVLKGPETKAMLYLGKEEEARLGLKTYAEQLEDVAALRKRQPEQKGENISPGAKVAKKTQVSADKIRRTMYKPIPHNGSGGDEVFTCVKTLQKSPIVENAKDLEDGIAFLGESG